MLKIFIDESLVETEVAMESKEEVLHMLCQKFDKQGLVKPEFEQAVLRRESEFPTGLKTSIPVAICHVEEAYINQSALGVAVLQHPIPFHQMDEPSHELPVEIVFLFALKDPKDQVVCLKKMMQMFKSDTLTVIKQTTEKSDVASILKKNLSE
jgi:PTS system galactitol-specific IIA component